MTFAPVTATCEYVPFAPTLRRMVNPASLLELSVQLRLTCVPDAAVAARLDGAAGAVVGSGAYVQLMMSCVELSPPVPPVKPTYAVLAPTMDGMFTV